MSLCRCDEDGPLEGRVWGVVQLCRNGRTTTHLVECPLAQAAYKAFVEMNTKPTHTGEKGPR